MSVYINIPLPQRGRSLSLLNWDSEKLRNFLSHNLLLDWSKIQTLDFLAPKSLLCLYTTELYLSQSHLPKRCIRTDICALLKLCIKQRTTEDRPYSRGNHPRCPVWPAWESSAEKKGCTWTQTADSLSAEQKRTQHCKAVMRQEKFLKRCLFLHEDILKSSV